MSEAFSPLLPAWKFRFSAVTEGNREFGFVVCSLVPLLHLLTSWLKFSGWGARNVSQNVFRLSVFSARFLPVIARCFGSFWRFFWGRVKNFFKSIFSRFLRDFEPPQRVGGSLPSRSKLWRNGTGLFIFLFLIFFLTVCCWLDLAFPCNCHLILNNNSKKKRNWLLIQKEKENEREIKRKTKYFASRPADRVSYCENGPAYKNQRLHRHRRSHFKRQTHFWIKYWIYWFSPCFAGWLMSRMEFDAADFNNNRNKIVTWCVNFAIISAAETFDRWKRSRAPIRLFTVLHFF